MTFLHDKFPSGFTLNSANGDWTWTPNTPGTLQLQIYPADVLGLGPAATYQFVVNAQATATPGAGSSAVAPSGGGATQGLVAAALLLPLRLRMFSARQHKR